MSNHTQIQSSTIGWKVPLVSLADHYLVHHETLFNLTRHKFLRSALKAVLIHLPRDILVGEVRVHHADVVITKMQLKYSRSTVNSHLAVMFAVFTWAQRRELIDLNPWQSVRKPIQERREYLPEPEVQARLLAVVPEPLRQLLWALQLTGCRPGELCNRTWANVELDHKFCLVIAQHKTRKVQPGPNAAGFP